MLKNVGALDRVIRIVLGLALVAYALGFIAPGVGYPALGWIGLIPLATAAMGSCPLYSMLGFSSCSVKAAR